MDVIDDLIQLLLRLIDYLGFDVQQMSQLFLPLETRDNGRNNIRNRSIIRRIGSRLPLKPPPRIEIQTLILQNKANDSFDSLLSSGPCLDVCDWVEEDLGDNCIMIRPRDSYDINEVGSEDTFLKHHQGEARSSTPVGNSCSVSTLVDSHALQKISALEEELAQLRAQMAAFVSAQEKLNKTNVYLDSCSLSEGIPPYPPPTQVSLPPPPPPPPPPPAPVCNTGIFKTPKSSMPLASLIAQKKDLLSHASDDKPVNKPKGPLDMTEILKGLGTVKLRSVQRSPGGTPLRKQCLNSESSDPGTLIANALKKKFANHHVYSPDIDKENSPRSFSSPDESPQFPFGQHILKRTRKRSLLLEERRKSQSPLREIVT